MGADNADDGQVEGRPQEGEGVKDLVSSLQELSVQENKGVEHLEECLAQVTLKDSEEEDEAEVGERDEEQCDKKKAEEVADKQEDGDEHNLKDDESEEGQTDQENNEVVKEHEDDSTNREEDESCDENEPEKDGTDVGKDGEESSDENEPDTFVAREKGRACVPCIRGLGQPMHNYQFQGQSYGVDNFGVNSFSQGLQQASADKYNPYRSPQYASSPGLQVSYMPDQSASGFYGDSPGHPNMSPGYTISDTSLHSPVTNTSLSSELGSTNLDMGFFTHYLPDTPPSSHLDENEVMQMPSPEYMTDYPLTFDQQDLILPLQNSKLEALFEAIDRVEHNNSQPLAIPYEDLLAITESLKSCEETNNTAISTTDIKEILEVATKNLQADSPMDLINYNRKAVLYKADTEANIKTQVDPIKLNMSRKTLAFVKNEQLIAKDADGDFPCIIVACEDLSKPEYMENLVATEERQRGIHLCCDLYVKQGSRCSNCDNDNQATFYSPLSMKNNDGDTVLSSVIKLKYPASVINFICASLLNRSADLLRVFDGESSFFYRRYEQVYPILKHLLDMTDLMRNFQYFEPWGNV